MAKYRSKSLVDVYSWDGNYEALHQWVSELDPIESVTHSDYDESKGLVWLGTIGPRRIVYPGDKIIADDHGHLSVCPRKQFDDLFEVVDD